MAYSVQFKPMAVAQLERLPREIRRRLAARIEMLREEPTPVGCKKLAGLDDTWRVRMGDYRAVYQVKRSILVVLVLKIGHRREVYR